MVSRPSNMTAILYPSRRTHHRRDGAFGFVDRLLEGHEATTSFGIELHASEHVEQLATFTQRLVDVAPTLFAQFTRQIAGARSHRGGDTSPVLDDAQPLVRYERARY